MPSTVGKNSLVALLILLSGGLATTASAEYLKISDTFTIHYEQSGNGDIPIIFIPGWTMSTKVYARQLEHFADSDRFRAITYDPRGQGLSTKTLEGHTYQQHGRDLKAFMDKLNLSGVVLAGWSWGVLDQFAYINQSGAENLKAAIIIDGSPKSTGLDNSTDWVWYRKDDADGFRQWFTMGPLEDRATFNAEFAKWMLEDQSTESLAWVDEISSQTSSTVAALLNETGAYLDYSKDLVGLEGKVPLLYVVREEWGEVVNKWAKENTPTAEVVPMGKHLMFWERASEFNAVLDKFLERVQ
jgi:pimeloyl-ACP methyl ester carboxylesterase